MISMPQEVLEEFDKAAKSQHKRRSELIKDLMIEYLRGGSFRGPRYLPAENPFERLREFTFELEPGETAESLIRKERESH